MKIDHLQKLVNRRRRTIAGYTRVCTIADYIPALKKSAKKHDRVVSAVMDFWRSQDLPHLDAISKISYRRGVLTIHIQSSSARYQFDQLIRAPDLFRDTVRAAPATLSRIRTLA